MKINGVELGDLDIYDLEVAEKYDNVLARVESLGDKSKYKNMTNTEFIKFQCGEIFNVFNTMFGEGTDKKVFGCRVNLLDCVKAFDELVSQMNEQKSEFEKITSKYSANRAQRRAKK